MKKIATLFLTVFILLSGIYAQNYRKQNSDHNYYDAYWYLGIDTGSIKMTYNYMTIRHNDYLELKGDNGILLTGVQNGKFIRSDTVTTPADSTWYAIKWSEARTNITKGFSLHSDSVGIVHSGPAGIYEITPMVNFATTQDTAHDASVYLRIKKNSSVDTTLQIGQSYWFPAGGYLPLDMAGQISLSQNDTISVEYKVVTDCTSLINLEYNTNDMSSVPVCSITIKYVGKLE